MRYICGFSVNVTPSIEIFGISVNQVIYLAIAFIFILLYSIKYFKMKELKECITFAFEGSFIVLLTFWGLLTLNAYINYFFFWRPIYPW